jgi:hypothetical protein
MIDIPKEKIPPGAKEGDILIIEGDSIDSGGSAKRKKDIEVVPKIWTGS